MVVILRIVAEHSVVVVDVVVDVVVVLVVCDEVLVASDYTVVSALFQVDVLCLLHAWAGCVQHDVAQDWATR